MTTKSDAYRDGNAKEAGGVEGPGRWGSPRDRAKGGRRALAALAACLLLAVLPGAPGCVRGTEVSWNEAAGEEDSRPEIPAEEDRAEARRIVELLALEPGETVADVGSGDGEWTAVLARAVGPAGKVWANGIHREGLDEVEELMEELGLEQVETALGDQESTGLPRDCCSAMLLRLVYHHFTDPPAMRRALDEALKPGARLLVIDIRPQTHWRDLEGVPDRGGHGITPEELISELEGNGFTAVSRHDAWDGDEDRFAVLFRAPG